MERPTDEEHGVKQDWEADKKEAQRPLLPQGRRDRSPRSRRQISRGSSGQEGRQSSSEAGLIPEQWLQERIGAYRKWREVTPSGIEVKSLTGLGLLATGIFFEPHIEERIQKERPSNDDIKAWMQLNPNRAQILEADLRRVESTIGVVLDLLRSRRTRQLLRRVLDSMEVRP